MFFGQSKKSFYIKVIASGILLTANATLPMQYDTDDKQRLEELYKSIDALDNEFLKNINSTMTSLAPVLNLDYLIADIKNAIDAVLFNVEHGTSNSQQKAASKDVVDKMREIKQINSKLFNCIDILNTDLPEYVASRNAILFTKNTNALAEYQKLNTLHEQTIKETITRLSRIESDLSTIEASMLKKFKTPELISLSAKELKKLTNSMKKNAENILKNKAPKKTGVLKRIFGKK